MMGGLSIVVDDKRHDVDGYCALQNSLVAGLTVDSSFLLQTLYFEADIKILLLSMVSGDALASSNQFQSNEE